MTDERTPLTESANRAFNPMNWPDYYRQYRPEDPDDPDAGEIRDPDGWDDPDPPRRERYTPNTTAQWILVIAGGLIGLGLLAYLYPVFAPAYRSPIALAVFIALAYTAVVYLKGREDGMDAYRSLDKWVNYDGNGIEVRPGEHVGASGPWKLFEVIRNVSYGGFTKRKLQKRDLPYNATKLRTDQNDTGEEPARDALNPTTEIADCSHLGTFLFTHSNGLDYADGMAGAHRETTHPRTLDEDAFDEFLRLINELEHEVATLEDDVEMLRDHVDSTSNLRDELQTPQLEETVRLMQELKQLARRQPQRADDSGVKQSPFPGPNTEMPFDTTSTEDST